MKKSALVIVLLAVVVLVVASAVSGEANNRIITLETLNPDYSPSMGAQKGTVTIRPFVDSALPAPYLIYSVHMLAPARGYPNQEFDFYTLFMKLGEGGNWEPISHFNTDLNAQQVNVPRLLPDFADNPEALLTEPVEFYVCQDLDDGDPYNVFCVLHGSDPGSG
jgi:hypothetical protein